MNTFNYQFSKELKIKIDLLKSRRKPCKIGSLTFSSPIIMAPLASITDTPYRLLMQKLGSGGSVSELISAYGIQYENEKTFKMLHIGPTEKNVGIQLFGDEAKVLTNASIISQNKGASFIDLNVGCPVKKVIKKGAGSALLRNLPNLLKIISSMKKALHIPLTMKIRTGWSEDEIVVRDILNMAYNEGVEFVSIHGRTQKQLYRGTADWQLIENEAKLSKIPVIGNGDLHTPQFIHNKLLSTNTSAVMLGRGPLRFPFIFLESYIHKNEELFFTPKDHLEVINQLYNHMLSFYQNDKIVDIQLKKHIVWMTSGYSGSSQFRKKLFTLKGHDATIKHIEEYLSTITHQEKNLNLTEPFMAGGHG